MFKFSLFIWLCISLNAHAQERYQSIQDAIITDPSISRRCDDLIGKRKKKIQHRQRLEYLNNRNTKLQKLTPKEKVSIRERLEFNQDNIYRELKLTQLQIQGLDESIIRRGCPGIRL